MREMLRIVKNVGILRWFGVIYKTVDWVNLSGYS